MNRKRNIEIKLRLSKDELRTLDRSVKKTTLSREGYIRTLVCGYEPQAVPPMDYYDVLNELRTIEDILRRLADCTPVSNMENMAVYSANAKKLSDICGRLQDAFLPRRKE